MSSSAYPRPVGPSERERGEACIVSPTGAQRFYEKVSFSVEEAGALIGLKKSAAYKAAKAGRLPTVDVPGGQRVTASALDRLLHPDEWADVPEPVTPEVEASADPVETWTEPEPWGAEVVQAEPDTLAKAHEEHVQRSRSLLQYGGKPKPQSKPTYERLPVFETASGAVLGGGALLPDGQGQPPGPEDDPDNEGGLHYIPYGSV